MARNPKLPSTFHACMAPLDPGVAPEHTLTDLYLEECHAPRRGESIEGRYRQVSGGHWFDPDTHKWFGTVFPSHYAYKHVASGRIVFLTRDYTGFDRRRKGYTVRAFDWLTGSIDTIGNCGGYATRAPAERAAVRYLLTGEGSTLRSHEHTPCTDADSTYPVQWMPSDCIPRTAHVRVKHCDPVTYENPQRGYCGE